MRTSAVTAVKKTRACVCLSWGKVPAFSLRRWTADRILLPPHLALWVRLRGFLMWAHPLAYLCWRVHKVFISEKWLCTGFYSSYVSVCFSMCKPLLCLIASTCSGTVLRLTAHGRRYLGDKHCWILKVHACKVKWKIRTVRCLCLFLPFTASSKVSTSHCILDDKLLI